MSFSYQKIKIKIQISLFSLGYNKSLWVSKNLPGYQFTIKCHYMLLSDISRKNTVLVQVLKI